MFFDLQTLVLVSAFLVLIYYYLTKNFNFWSSRGVNGPKPVVLFGTFYQNFFKSMQDVALDNSRKYGKIYGAFFGSKPFLMISDPQLIKEMNIRDFHIFADRDDLVTGDQLNDRSLFNLKGDEWKAMRSIISPTFSSGKMRSMHPIVIDCVKRLETHLEAYLQKGSHEIELKKNMSNLTMDVIALCAFGTKIDIYGEKRSDFLTYAQKIVNPSVRVWVLFLIVIQFPKFLKWTGLSLMDPGASRFFQAAVRSIISRRQADQVKHNDYLQLMLNAQNKTLDTSDEPDIDGDKSEQIYGPIDANKNPIANKVKMDVTEVDVLASSFIFFVAGYETTGSLLTFLFYRLALDEECQRKLYEEVSRFDGNYSYENFVKMTYLEACIAETLRLYNPLVFNERIAAEDYKLGDTGITIPKGTFVDIDVWSLHHNPEYYPNPDRWDPERFMPENRDQLVPYTYMPFGTGPRNCVGMRFALMEAKTAAAHLVNKFEFSRTADTPTELKPQKLQFLLNCGEIKVGIKSRK